MATDAPRGEHSVPAVTAGLDVTRAVNVLKAAGDPSRLRILAALEHHELTVGELVQVLGQSQPRVSRHLKVLVEAGLLRRTAEGTSAYYRLDRPGDAMALLASLLPGLNRNDADIERDQARLRQIRSARAERAATYFEEVAASWDCMRSTHVPEADIERALIEQLEDRPEGRLLDLGTGTGRILEIAAPHVSSGVGIDTSRDMLTVARDRLERERLHHCQVRRGDVYNVDVPSGSVDTAVIHHVLHYLDDPETAITEAARVLAPGGRLVIVDFAPHDITSLHTEFRHTRLGFSDQELEAWCRSAGLQSFQARHFTPDNVHADVLTVVLWTATQRADARSTYPLEVA